MSRYIFLISIFISFYSSLCAQTLSLNNPNGGEIMDPNSLQIIWFDRENKNSVDIFFSGDSGNVWSEIVSDYAWQEGDRYYWTTPTIESAGCLIKLVDSSDSTNYRISKLPFTISSSAEYPNGVFPLEVGNEWYFFHLDRAYVRTILKVEKDTLMDDGYVYSKIDRYDRAGGVVLPDTFRYSWVEFYLRQEENKVYKYPGELILNFNWHVGDSSISSILYQEISNRYYRAYSFSFNEFEHITYLDSLGFFSLRNADYGVNDNRYLVGCKINGRSYGDVLTTIESYSEIPENYNLTQNYPNPFNSQTTIRFTVKEKVSVSLVIYDILGNKVKELVNDVRSPGMYNVSFDATNLSSGVYFYRIICNNKTETKKMILLK